MCFFLPLARKKKRDNLWIHHFVGLKQRITLKEIIITNEYGSMIEVEQSLKQSQSWYNQGL